MPKKRTYPLRVERILAECDKRAWEYRDLARHADIDAKTVTNVLTHRENASLPTVLALSRALNIDHMELIDDRQSLEHTRSIRFNCSITVDLPADRFDDPREFQRWLNEFSERIQQVGEMVIERLTDGSVIVDFWFTRKDDVHSMVRTFCGLNLHSLRVTKLVIPARIDIDHDVAEGTRWLTASFGYRIKRIRPFIPRNVDQWYFFSIPGSSGGYFFLTLHKEGPYRTVEMIEV